MSEVMELVTNGQQADAVLAKNYAALTNFPTDWITNLTVPDFPWIATPAATYAAILQQLPDVFGWSDSPLILSSVKILDQSTNVRRLASLFEHIHRHDSQLATAMLETFTALPLANKIRFMTAPETYHKISRLLIEPVPSLIALTRFLNGESVYSGKDSIAVGYYTALGDFYTVADQDCHHGNAVRQEDAWILRSPQIDDCIPIDFYSPNVENARVAAPDTTEQIYTNEEISLVTRRLNEVYSQIRQVSEPAADLIRTFIKVIIPIKVPQGSGSTSQPRFPGRVLLRGVERCSPGSIASALIHESIHQLLYILEYAGVFVIQKLSTEYGTPVKSLWSGRELELHSYTHACFVWYGLASFWAQAHRHSIFQERHVARELKRSMVGFQAQNPTETLLPYTGVVRKDIVNVASRLQDRLAAVQT